MKQVFSMLLFTAVTLGIEPYAFSQEKPRDPKHVAILLYDGVELLDFAGPGEVFSAAGFNTYTVSVDGKKLISQGFVTILPEFSIDNAPTPDILVIPGGNSTPTTNNPKVIEWIKDLNGDGSAFISVCTGAFILSKAGLLDNKRVTTHWGSTKSLAKTNPTVTVLEDTRFVDNGNVITTAGVSAGIDGALHFVSRIKGVEAAKKAARYMEYDKWSPDYGVVDKKNEYIEALLNGQSPSKQAPYPGEFINAGIALKEKSRYADAEKILEDAVKHYPNSSTLYGELADVYKKLGKLAPSTQTEIINLMREGKVDEAFTQIEKNKKNFPGWKLYDEDTLNGAGYFLMYEKNDIQNAIRVFQLNVSEYPNSFNVYDSLGEAYLKAGKKDLAIVNYQKSLMLDGKNNNARKVLTELGALN